MAAVAPSKSVGVLMVGTGEYTTGWTAAGASGSDKRLGVVALVMFDLRRRGMVDRIVLAGTNGTKMPLLRKHFADNMAAVYRGFDCSFESFPPDDVPSDCRAYLSAMDSMKAGDVVTVFTPDDTHFDICMAAIQRGLHVLVTKPAVKTLAEHRELAAAAARAGVRVCIEFHKRWDPIYADARARIACELGPLSFMSAYMSQPKAQLTTFAHWAGTGSDISYYLNAHHVDFAVWAAPHSRPLRVCASAATGVACAEPYCKIGAEDTICLTVQWEHLATGARAIAIFSASWIAPPSDVHSQQRFHCMGQTGEVIVDQAHRGYSLASDAAGFKSLNPLYMRYTPVDGMFAGQLCYGYRSLEAFVLAAAGASPDATLAGIEGTMLCTAILEAGRRSLDADSAWVVLEYEGTDRREPTGMHLQGA